MKISIAGAMLLLVASFLMIGTIALAQSTSDTAAAGKKKSAAAHLAFSRRSIGFGVVKAVTTKSLTIRNTGKTDASVTVSGPAAPFAMIEGGGTYSLAPASKATISIEFAPTAKGPVSAEFQVECGNCNSADVIHLRGNAREPVATPTPVPTASPTPSPGTANALPMSVTVGPFQSADVPYVSLTICATGTSSCATVNNILLDTGSFGLRVFASQISGLGITPNTNQGSEVGECALFGSGSTWGSVSTVDTVMAGEPKITIPIQVIDDIGKFPPAPSNCTQGSVLMGTPQQAGFDGIIGVGQATNDVFFTYYYNCSGGSCSTPINPAQADIVPNPVAALPVDNNGVVVSLPSIPADGEATVNGTLYFGIGTEADNQPGVVQTFAEDSNPGDNNYLDINTTYKGNTGPSFFDTGSNGYFFNDTTIANCPSGSGFYCPATTLSESATNLSVGTPVSGVVAFQIANADTLFNSNDAAFNNLGGSFDGGSSYDGFDWGLPFFFGRTVYIGMSGTQSSLGTGPYTAY
ncbi:MAG: DUF3443 family protein [Candidatus Binataceae bacterium]